MAHERVRLEQGAWLDKLLITTAFWWIPAITAARLAPHWSVALAVALLCAVLYLRINAALEQRQQQRADLAVLEQCAAIGDLRRRTVLATAPFEAVLSPVAPMLAFPADWPMPWGHDDRGMAHIGFTLPYNMSGQPASSINAGFAPDGRAIALQIAGRRFADREVLALTSWWEHARPADAVPAFP